MFIIGSWCDVVNGMNCHNNKPFTQINRCMEQMMTEHINIEEIEDEREKNINNNNKKGKTAKATNTSSFICTYS